MGSTSDLPVMQDAIDVLKELDIEIQVDVVSAHRTPEKMFEFGKTAHENGIAVIIAGAGSAFTWNGSELIATTSNRCTSKVQQLYRWLG